MILDRNSLLKELKKKYSFEKAHSIIQITIEDGYFKNDKVDILVSNIVMESFRLKWL